MDAIEKLLRKASRKDKERLLEAMLLVKNQKLSGIKLKNSEYYRVRIGSYRIIYTIDTSNSISIVTIRRRNEQTYK